MSHGVVRLASATLLAVGGLTLTVAQAHADDPVLHHVRYTVTAQSPTSAKIYYRDVDPPNWADYSHNPYVFSPRAEADLGPGKAWTLDVMLADPAQWAMVTASSGLSTATPMFSCQLELDGQVVVTNDGPKGALCSMRTW